MGWPTQITRIIGRVTFTNRLRYVAAAFRLAVGAVLDLVAEQTGFPLTMQILAGFSVLCGVAVLLISHTTSFLLALTAAKALGSRLGQSGGRWSVPR